MYLVTYSVIVLLFPTMDGCFVYYVLSIVHCARTALLLYYGTFIIRLTHANVWESMGKPCSCTQFIKSHIFYSKSRKNQVTRESVSGSTSHVRCVRTCNEIGGSYDKIIITIVPSYTGKNITRSLPLALLLMSNNTDGNKLMIFSGIALYFGDTYIIASPFTCKGVSREMFAVNC